MLNVLIVDDDRNLCKCLMELIPWSSMQCAVPSIAYNGLNALDIMQSSKIDFVVCDLRMPVMDGAELSKVIRKEYPETKIVFLSAYEDFDVARQALQYGITDYIIKPLNRESLEILKKHIYNAVESNKSKEYEKKLFGGEYNECIFEALCNKNEEYLESIIAGLSLLEETATTNGCIYLLHILYEYLYLLHREDEQGMYDMVSRKSCHELMGIQEATERIGYVRNKYTDELITKDTSDFSILIHKIKQLVRESYCNQDCNVSWLAEKVHLSAPYIGRIFCKYTGIGLSEYITDTRLRKASDLLKKDVLSINEIAIKVGYVDANYFTKVFRNKMRISPSDYRKRSCKMEGE